MRRLENPIQPYAWGSRTAIAKLQGRPTPSEGPEAELWLGAHPGGASLMAATAENPPTALSEAIEQAPLRLLGGRSLERFGPRLPFLFKYLAAAAPLSIQAHPDAGQAAAGFAAEASLAPAERSYVDPYAKPELLVALEPFDALCGFAEPGKSAALLDSLGVAQLAPVVAALSDGSTQRRLAEAVRLLLSWPPEQREELVSAVARAGELAGVDLAAQLARRYPGDMGVVVALLLNRVRLRPDDAIFMPAGNPHAYLEGVGVELMGASDNVLRGGLTPKRVDVTQLLRVLRYEVLDDPVVHPHELAEGLVGWGVAVEEFSLVKAVVGRADAVKLPAGGPRIVLVTSGPAELTCGQRRAVLAQGEAVFVPGDAPEVVVTAPTAGVRAVATGLAGASVGAAGAAVVFQATTG